MKGGLKGRSESGRYNLERKHHRRWEVISSRRKRSS
jgi:hypothetical protein